MMEGYAELCVVKGCSDDFVQFAGSRHVKQGYQWRRRQAENLNKGSGSVDFNKYI